MKRTLLLLALLTVLGVAVAMPFLKATKHFEQEWDRAYIAR